MGTEALSDGWPRLRESAALARLLTHYRFTLAIDAIDRIPRLRVTAAGAREELVNQRIACEQYAYQHGIDRPDITGWKWPF
jgi:phosphoketolase